MSTRHLRYGEVLISELLLMENIYSEQYIVSSIQVQTPMEMLEFLREMSVPKLSALILRCMFYFARFLGIFCFRFKSTTDDQVTMEESGPWWKWSMTIFLLGCVCLFTWSYLEWMGTFSDLLRQSLHFLRMSMNIGCIVCIQRLYIFHGPKCTQMVNRFLQLFQRVRVLSKGKRKGFGGTQELVLLTLSLICIIYSVIFMLGLLLFQRKWNIIYKWFADSFIATGSKLITHIAFVAYLALGLLYADLNDYVRTQLRSQLESLEEQPTPRKLRRARKSLDKCLALYVDIQSLTSAFQRIFDLPLLFCLGRSCSSIAIVAYSAFVQMEISMSWLWTMILTEILALLLLTLSVQRATVQFGVIRSLMLDNCYLSENKEWHKTLDVFFNHLNLYEFQVRPLGLFNVSNEFVLVFLSAMITYFTVVIQYGMQLEALTLSLSNK